MIEQRRKLLRFPLQAADDRAPPPTPEEADRFKQLAKISPRAAMLGVRRELEDALRRTADRLNVLETRRISMLTMTRVLRSIGAIDQHTSALLEELRNIGIATEQSAESTDLTEKDAFKFRELANQAIERLDSIPPTQTP